MSRKPDYRVAAMNKVTNTKNNIGGGWINDNKSITVVIDDFIVVNEIKML